MTKKATSLPSNYIHFIPKWVFDTDLSATDLRVYLYILYKWRVYSYHKSEFMESISTIAEAIDCVERSVKSALRKLEDKKIISIQRRCSKGRKATSIITPLSTDGRALSSKSKNSMWDWEDEELPF